MPEMTPPRAFGPVSRSSRCSRSISRPTSTGEGTTSDIGGLILRDAGSNGFPRHPGPREQSLLMTAPAWCEHDRITEPAAWAWAGAERSVFRLTTIGDPLPRGRDSDAYGIGCSTAARQKLT